MIQDRRIYLFLLQLEKITDFRLVMQYLHCKSLLMLVFAFVILKIYSICCIEHTEMWLVVYLTISYYKNYL